MWLLISIVLAVSKLTMLLDSRPISISDVVDSTKCECGSESESLETESESECTGLESESESTGSECESTDISSTPCRVRRAVHKTLSQKTETRPRRSTFKTETRPSRRSIFSYSQDREETRRSTFKTETIPRRSKRRLESSVSQFKNTNCCVDHLYYT